MGRARNPHQRRLSRRVLRPWRTHLRAAWSGKTVHIARIHVSVTENATVQFVDSDGNALVKRYHRTVWSGITGKRVEP